MLGTVTVQRKKKHVQELLSSHHHLHVTCPISLYYTQAGGSLLFATRYSCGGLHCSRQAVWCVCTGGRVCKCSSTWLCLESATVVAVPFDTAGSCLPFTCRPSGMLKGAATTMLVAHSQLQLGAAVDTRGHILLCYGSLLLLM